MDEPKYYPKYDALYDEKVELFAHEYGKKETQDVIKALARDARDKLEELLKEKKIKAIVTTRAKDPESLRKKLIEAREDFIPWLRQPEDPKTVREKRLAKQEVSNHSLGESKAGSQPPNLSTSDKETTVDLAKSNATEDSQDLPVLDDLRWNLYEHEDVGDFAGARIGLYLPGDILKTGRIIKEAFETFHVFGTVLDTTRSVRTGRNEDIEAHGRKRWTRVSSDIRDDWEHYGYKSWQVIVKWKKEWQNALPGIAGLPAIFQPLRVEIQIGTVITQAWAEMQHDIIYKQPEHIQTTPTMFRMVDATNGMAITTDILLEELEKSREKAIMEAERSAKAAQARRQWEKDDPGAALMYYTKHGQFAARENFLNNISDINAVLPGRYTGGTLLHVAAFKNFSGLVSELLDAKADVNAKHRNGDTALHIACRASYIDVVDVLLRKADIEITNHEGNTAFLIAVRCRALGVVKRFVARRDLRKHPDLFKALQVASILCDYKIIKELLRVEVDWEEMLLVDPVWREAALEGAAAVVAEFRIAGIDMSSKDEAGMTALHCAADLGHAAVVRELARADVDLEARSKDNKTALLMATHVAVVKELADAGANLEARSANNKTALHMAYNAAVVKELAEAGADLEARSNKGKTALHLASLYGDTSVVKALIEARANLEAQADDKKTPLHCAAFLGHAGVVKALVQGGADLEARADDKGTPLHCAAHLGHAGAVKELVQAGADLEAKNGRGRSALFCAGVYGQCDAARVLISAGAKLLPTEINVIIEGVTLLNKGEEMIALLTEAFKS